MDHFSCMRLKTILLLIFSLSFASSMAQALLIDSAYSCGFFQIHYGLTVPGGDMAKRYGLTSNVGLSISFKTDKNWVWGGCFDYLFGNKVKETDILKNIATKDGFVIDANGTYADIFLLERGFQASANVGKIIPINKTNLNSGIIITAGAGYLMHKIRIENTDNAAPQVKGDYKKGYDRLAGGLSLNQFVGYIYFGPSKVYNCYAGFEITEGFTRGLRQFNFDTQLPGNETRLDLLYGFRVGWVIPFRKHSGQVVYYY